MMLARAIRASLIAGLVAVPMSPAMAEIQWNGFLSVGAGMTFDDDEKLAGYDNDLSFAPDSILGLQASSELGGKPVSNRPVGGPGRHQRGQGRVVVPLLSVQP